MDWWNKNAVNRMGDLLAWLGPVSAISRAIMREHVMRKQYRSIVDVGCGPSIDHVGFSAAGYEIAYYGVDQCEAFAAESQRRGLSVQVGASNALPFPDRFADVVYCRHVLEHLEEPETTLAEMLRVAAHEVIVTFFLPPGIEDDLSESEDDGCLIHHNRWSQRRLSVAIWQHPRVRRVRWQPVNEEAILFVELADG